MTGPEHYRAAEFYVTRAENHLTEDPRDMEIAKVAMGIAQVHATLALAAATAEPIAQEYNGREDVSIPQAWTAAIS
jgi:hypothetical protein